MRDGTKTTAVTEDFLVNPDVYDPGDHSDGGRPRVRAYKNGQTTRCSCPAATNYTRSNSPAWTVNPPATLRNHEGLQLDSGCGRLLAQSGEEPTDLVAGQRDQLVSVWVLMVSLGGGQHDQECVGEQGQDGPRVLGGPAADLVLVQGGQFLAASEPVPNDRDTVTCSCQMVFYTFPRMLQVIAQVRLSS
jgi:hypothetical protein